MFAKVLSKSAADLSYVGTGYRHGITGKDHALSTHVIAVNVTSLNKEKKTKTYRWSMGIMNNTTSLTYVTKIIFSVV